MNRLNCDVFHGTDFSVPYLPLRPSVLTLHDLSPWTDIRLGTTTPARPAPNTVLTQTGNCDDGYHSTEAVRVHAIEHFKFAPSRIVAVHSAAGSQCIRSRQHLPLFRISSIVGAIEPRKNVPAVIAAWRRSAHAMKWICARGQRRADGPSLPATGLRILGEVDDQYFPRSIPRTVRVPDRVRRLRTAGAGSNAMRAPSDHVARPSRNRGLRRRRNPYVHRTAC